MFMVADPCLKSLYLVAGTIVVKTSKFHGEIHSNVYPALVGVGYICGLKIATLMFAGSLLGWVVIIPMIHTFGQDAVMFPAKITIGEIWENAGVFNFIAQKFFGRPRFSYINLEEFGSFIWKQIDGKSTIFEIGKSVSEKFKDKAEPLYPRLSQYFKTLQLHGFINAE